MKKIIIIVLAAAVLGAVGYQLYNKVLKRRAPAGQRQGAPVVVVTEQVQRLPLEDIGEFSGSLSPGAQFVVSPKIGGRLTRLSVDVGDEVRKGDVIAELDDDEASQQVEQARAELEVTRANLDDAESGLLLAQREYTRAKSLWEKQILSASEFDQAEAELRAKEAQHKVSLAQVRQKEAALRTAEVRLSYTEIHATWNSGNDRRVVGERFVDEGVLLKANDPIVSILDIDTLTAVIQVIERDYPRVRPGQPTMVLSDLFPGTVFEGHVVNVSPLLKEEARQAEVKVELSNPGRKLKPGMFVRVMIEFARKDDVSAVPVGALTQKNGVQGVFLLDGDGQHVRFVPVSVGIIQDGHAEILDPPISGSVITLGKHLLDDGSTVKVSGG
jgi:RND family efflux transporter MFP subunit